MNVNAAAVLLANDNSKGAWDLLEQDPLTHEQRLKVADLFAAIRKRSSRCTAETALLTQVLCGSACNRHLYGSSKSYLGVPSSPLGFQVKLVSIEFSNGLNGDDLDFDPKEINIHCYPNYNELRLAFSFLKNGFEYCEFQGPMQASIERLSAQPLNSYYRLELALNTIGYLTQWGKRNEIDFDYVGFVGFFYRNSDIKGDGSRPAFFAHIDFKASDMKNTLAAFKNEWKPNLEQTLGFMTDTEYSSLNITQIVNLWLPFNTDFTSNTLAVMDLSSVESSPLRLDDYVTLTPAHDAEFTTLIVQPNPDQVWVAHESMSLGQGLIFNSFKLPHCSVTIPNSLALNNRRSVEGRFLFGKKPRL